MRLNGMMYRLLKAPRKGDVKVQLGPGQKNYIDGWINVDANMFTGKCDVWVDLRNPLPFHNTTVNAFYSHHMIEHLPNIHFHLSEIFRCLKPGGIYRVGGPNGDAAIRKYVENDSDWFRDFPDNRKSIGGRFENFIFCRGEHLTILTFSMLEELLSEIGYTNIISCNPVNETNYPELFQDCLEKEHESDFNAPHTLIIEAAKPDSDAYEAA
jgi:predicted SAM-dependent methyltransferase